MHCDVMAQPDNITCMYVGFLLGHHVDRIISGPHIRTYTEAKAMGAIVNDSYYGQCVPDEFRHSANILLQQAMPASNTREKQVDREEMINNMKNQARRIYERMPEQFRSD